MPLYWLIKSGFDDCFYQKSAIHILTLFQKVTEPGTRYNVPLMNALVLYVGTQAIAYIQSKSGAPSISTITHSSHMDIFQNLAVDLDTEGKTVLNSRVEANPAVSFWIFCF